MRKVCVKIYKYDELSDSAKGAALEGMRYCNTEYLEWYEDVFYDARRMATLMGIEISSIYFSGFSSQGDGACFEGSYYYKAGSVKAIKSEAPKDTELHRIAGELYALQRKYFYRLQASVKHQGLYSHEFCTQIDVECSDGAYPGIETADALTEILRDFMRWIYRQLKQEFDYLTSDEAIEETIKANEYEFTKDGSIY